MRRANASPSVAAELPVGWPSLCIAAVRLRDVFCSDSSQGRLHFSNFVEAVVNVVCECTARALLEEAGADEHPATLEAPEAEIKKKAVVLLEIFGINDVQRIVLLTRRPLREASLRPEDSSPTAPASPAPALPTPPVKQAKGKSLCKSALP